MLYYETALAVKPDARAVKDKISNTKKLKAEYDIRVGQSAKIIAGADKLLQAEKRIEALAEYQKALVLTPENQYAKQKVQEIEKYNKDKNDLQANYDKIIEQADQFYIGRDFASAHQKYQEALKAKPEARYPKEMLEKTKSGENQLLTEQQKYDAALASAENLFKTADYNAALTAFESASTLKPAETYPKTRITEVKKLIAEHISRKEAYDIAIKNGDQALSEKKYEPALGHFRNALSLLADEKYPAQKIEEITAIVGQLKATEDNYTKSIAEADQFFKLNKFDDAIASYTKALGFKPDEAYPKQKISDAQNQLASLKSKEENYASALASGDKSLSELKYDEALASYKLALSLKPAEKYPKDKSDEINSILAKLKSDTDKYTLATTNGDKALASVNYAPALAAYQEALSIKPAEQYPQDKISEVKTAMAAQQKTNEAYAAAIKTADESFTARNYDAALTTYGEALKLKSSEKYPADQVARINKLLGDMHSADENYSNAIAEADINFNSQRYTEASVSYKKALLVKPAEAYPKSQLDKIGILVAEQKKRESDYSGMILSADKLLATKKYEDAITAYRAAQVLKPTEKYPSEKIAEAEKLVADLKALQESYDKAVAEGDKYLSDKDYVHSLTSFKSAGQLKPAEAYPKQKITEIQAILDKDKAEGQRYQEAITQADKFFTAQQYHEALEPYQRASGIRPSEKYPQDQLAKVNQLLADQKKLDDDYQKLLSDADALLKNAKYNDARVLYTNAGTLKPSEKLPKDKMAEIDSILADLQNKEQSFAKHISEGDAKFSEKNYAEAISSYSNALKIKPAETYPQAQIDKINVLVTEQKRLEGEYFTAVSSADKLYGAKKYEEAIIGYHQALALKPSEKYPADQITLAEKQVADLKTLQESYGKAVADGDKYLSDKDFANSLASYKSANQLIPGEAYPKQKIIEVQAILDKDKADAQLYDDAITEANRYFTELKYSEALEPYKRASAIKPAEKYPQEQLAKINQLLAEQKKLDSDYQKLITEADAQLKSGNYKEAQGAYTNAGLLKPTEQLPKDKIAEIAGILADIQKKEQNYSRAISEGDASLAEKKYTEATASYTDASGIKPTETYPKTQLDKIKVLLADQKKLDDDYQAALSAADLNFDGKKYIESITGYRKALVIKPAEKYPAAKIAEAEKLIADLKSLQESYDKAIADGDKSLLAKDYEAALVAFKSALLLKPAESYPSQKSTEIQGILDRQKAENERYLEAIALGDKFFTSQKYREAIEPYQSATTIKPGEKYPQDQLVRVNQLLGEQQKLEADYQKLLTDAATQVQIEKYDEALSLYSKAGALKPAENLPKEKIAEINSIVAGLKLRDENYTKSVNTASELYTAKNLAGAIKSYEEAQLLKPAEKFPQDRIAAIKAEIKAIDDSYTKAITLADSKLASKNLMEALNAYQDALEIKPAETYPKSKITEINTALLAQKEEMDKLYASYISEGDQFTVSKDYAGAKSAFTKAAGIKPDETYPKQKLAEIKKITDEIELARKAEYNKALGEADKLYNTKIFDQAIDAYEAAAKINPGDSYPAQQVSKIRKYMIDHAIQDLFSQTLLISEGTEKKFTFSSIEPRLRKNNYILLKARSTGKAAPKVYLNYGKDGQKNGGIVLRSLDKAAISDYLIRISVQDKWYREDNNWISLFVETGDIEITKVQIAAGDE